MPVLQIEAQLTTGQLLKAVEQMPPPELDQFVDMVVKLRAKHRHTGAGEGQSILRESHEDEAQRGQPLPGDSLADSRAQEIEELYERLANLRSHENGGAEVGAETEGELRTTFNRLRELQREEAAEFRGAAEARLLMQWEAGRRGLGEIDRLLDSE